MCTSFPYKLLHWNYWYEHWVHTYATLLAAAAAALVARMRSIPVLCFLRHWTPCLRVQNNLEQNTTQWLLVDFPLLPPALAPESSSEALAGLTHPTVSQ